MKNNENSLICGQCKGKCCKRVPGCWSVNDVLKYGKTIKKGLLNMIEKDLLQFDYWEGDILPHGKMGSVYFPRPTITTNNNIVFGSWATNDNCKLLTEKGCSLDWNSRPEGCKALEPNSNGDKFACRVIKGGYLKETASYEWRPHQKIIKQIIKG